VQNVLAHSFAIISILVAYSAVIGATWSTKPGAIPHWLTPFLPVPVFAAIAWHSQMNSLVFAHNQSVKVLEERLLEHAGVKRRWVGSTCGRLVTDLPILLSEKRIGMAAASITAYGGVLAIVLGLTGASVAIPLVNNDWEWLAWSMMILYLVIIVLLGMAYKSTFEIGKPKLDEWLTSAEAKSLR
jgi:hypothetical protein